MDTTTGRPAAHPLTTTAAVRVAPREFAVTVTCGCGWTETVQRTTRRLADLSAGRAGNGHQVYAVRTR